MAETTVQPNKAKLVTAHARNLHIAPRKMRLVTNLVNGMQVAQAITQLQFANKKAAPMVEKLLKSAMANAEHNFSMKGDNLFIKTITCDMGPTMKRYFPRARGSAFVIQRKTSHVHVVLEERPGKAGKKPVLKKAEPLEKSEDKSKKAVVAPEVSHPVIADAAKPITGSASKTAEQVKQKHVETKRLSQGK